MENGENKYLHISPPKQVVWAVVAFLGVATLLLLAQLKNEARGYNRTQPATTINVTGEGHEFIKPDIGMVSVGVVKNNKDVLVAQQEVARVMGAIDGFLNQQNVEEKDRKTTSFSINPLYDWTDGRRIFRGYEVRQTMEIKIRNLSKVGVILTGVAQSGANEVGSLNFTVDDPKMAQAKAQEVAIAEAQKKAKMLAKQLGVRLGKIVSFSEFAGGYPPPVPYFAAETFGKGGDTISAPISVGENEIRSQVSITYEIK